MSIYFLTNDLMFSSRVKGLAAENADRVQVCATIDKVADQIDENEKSLVILDLSTPGLNPSESLPKLRERGKDRLTILAFAPHVHESKLESARTASCDLVLTKGQFNSQIGEIIASHFE